LLILNHKNRKNFTFSFNGKHFTQLRHVSSKLLTSRKYEKKTKQWVAPLVCLSELLSLVHKNIPEEDYVEVSVEAQQACDELLKWRESMGELQKQGLGAQTNGAGGEPPGFKGILPPYQKIGVDYLEAVLEGGYSHGAILGDVVGLGKTVQAIAFVEKMRANGRITGNVLVVCPASLKRKWANEVQKFTSRRTIIIQPKSTCSKKKWKVMWEAPRDYTIINYDVLHRYWDEISGLKPRLLILDEIQYCKTPSAKRTRAARRLSRIAEMTVGLSATFLENTLEDLWSIFDIIDPDLFMGGWHIFDRNFIERDWFGSVTGYKNIDVCAKRIQPYVIRRRKEEVAEQLIGAIAGKVVETNYWVELSQAQKRMYREIESGIVGKIADMEKAGKIAMSEVFTRLIYLRQACLSTALIGAREGHIHSSKLDELIRIFGGFDPYEKVVIFCFFTGMVDMIAEALNAQGIEAVPVHGKNTTPMTRMDIITQFSEDEKLRVLVTSDALREGVDLQAASIVINFDLLWNPQAMQQRIGRIDRVGQKNQLITVINLIASGTIEERMKEVLNRKQDLFDVVVEGGWQSDRLSLREVKALLNLPVQRHTCRT